MNTIDILDILQREIHTVIIATIDENGNPMTTAIDLMLRIGNQIYFCTNRGKGLYRRLMDHPVISLTGMKGKDTLSTIAVSLQGKVKCLHSEKVNKIFEANPYLDEIYTTKQSKKTIEVFVIESCHGVFYDLSKKPLQRCTFSVNEDFASKKYTITDKCIGCGKCALICPQGAISDYTIDETHCLYCGRCAELCPVKAIEVI